MTFQCRNLNKNLLTALIILSNFMLAAQQDACTLPDGKGISTCIRLFHCNSFQILLRKYIGRPPQDIVQTIKSHQCAAGGFVCCPDSARSASVTTTIAAPVAVSAMEANLPKSPSDLNFLSNHPNFNLINEHSCGKSKMTNRIIAGINAEIEEFPWAVLLGYERFNTVEWRCGGSLISSRFVLTAAHCIMSDLTIARLGEHKISSIKDCNDLGACADPVQNIKIEKKTKHPHFKGSTGQKNDIGIIKLVSPADTTKNNVKTICLPTTDATDIEKFKLLKIPLTIAGWGRDESGNQADVLQKANVPYVENSDCVRRFAPSKIEILSTYLCAGGFNKSATCKGDSGGGIFGPGVNSKMYLYGISSGGVKCGYAELFPDIYTNIKYYLNWILDNMS